MRKRRRERLRLTVAAGSILFDPGKEAADQHRTCWCNRGIKTDRADAGVYRRLDGGGARLTNTIMCGSVWTCPTCAPRIMETRRRELQAGMVAAHKLGLHTYLLTLTFPHERADQVAQLVDRENRALKIFKQSPAWRDLKAHQGCVGSVRSRETTFGPNGPHPHTHTLLFAKPGLLERTGYTDRLRAAWLSAIGAVGLLPRVKLQWATEHAFDLRGGDKAADYIAKFGRDEQWGMSSEMTRHMAKAGTRGGLADFDGHVTPFQVLAWAADGDATARRWFQEYAAAYTGKRQLTWSPKLKTLFGIRDLDDDEITNTPAPEEQQIGCLNVDQLAILQQRRALPEFLDWIAEFAADQADIDAIVEHIGSSPPIARPWIMEGGRLSTFPKLEKVAA